MTPCPGDFAVARPIRVLFVGGFAEVQADGSVGGVLTASRSLLQSGISRYVEWIPLDSSSLSVPPPPLAVRTLRAGRRLFQFTSLLMRGHVDITLLFASDGASLIEKGLMALIARARGTRVIFAPRSGFVPDNLASSRLLRWFVPFVLQRCDRVLCQGAVWARFYGSIGVPPDRITTIPNWIEVPYALDRSAYGPRSDEVCFLYLGWVERFKGIFDLIDAAALAGSRLDGARFVICGRGSDLDAAFRHAAALGLAERFEFRGWVTGAAKDEVLRGADVYVHPSHREGMPNALLEAMGSGLACIAARSGGIPDLIPTPQIGVLYEAGDVAALADALSSLAADRERRLALGEAARQRILTEHGIDAAWPRVLELFRSVLPVRGAHQAAR